MLGHMGRGLFVLLSLFVIHLSQRWRFSKAGRISIALIIHSLDRGAHPTKQASNLVTFALVYHAKKGFAH